METCNDILDLVDYNCWPESHLSTYIFLIEDQRIDLPNRKLLYRFWLFQVLDRFPTMESLIKAKLLNIREAERLSKVYFHSEAAFLVEKLLCN